MFFILDFLGGDFFFPFFKSAYFSSYFTRHSRNKFSCSFQFLFPRSSLGATSIVLMAEDLVFCCVMVVRSLLIEIELRPIEPPYLDPPSGED